MGVRKFGDSVYFYLGSFLIFIWIYEGNVVFVDFGYGSGRYKDLRREVGKFGFEVNFQFVIYGYVDYVLVCLKIDVFFFIYCFEFLVVESFFNREILIFGLKVLEGFLVYVFLEEVKVYGVFEWGDEIVGLKVVQFNGYFFGMMGFLDEENGLIYVGDFFFGERFFQLVGLLYFVDVGFFWKFFEIL